MVLIGFGSKLINYIK